MIKFSRLHDLKIVRYIPTADAIPALKRVYEHKHVPTLVSNRSDFRLNVTVKAIFFTFCLKWL